MSTYRYCDSCGAAGRSDDTDADDTCPKCQQELEDQMARERDEDMYWRSVDRAYDEHRAEPLKEKS